jgi:antitoxin (DNA-binding transcriptional repressor) of toxin-antitoxin stability system
VARVYSPYEAKARLSEILRRVRGGQRVGISDLVAEVTPVERARGGLRERLRRLEKEGVIAPAGAKGQAIPRLGRRPGALKRFLESRG